MSRLYRPKAGFWIRFCVLFVFPISGLFFKVRFRHLERMPPASEGGVLVVANHLSQLDTFVMARCVWSSGRNPRFLIKAGVFDWPVAGRIMRGAGQIPVHRGTMDAAQSLGTAVTALERGEAVFIYPEGTTTKDPARWPMQSKTGVARLVLLAPDIPVVPVGQWGTHKQGHRRRTPFGRRRIAEAVIGEPLDLSRYRGQEASAENLREITDEIMGAVRELVAQLRGETPPAEFFIRQRTDVDKP